MNAAAMNLDTKLPPPVMANDRMGYLLGVSALIHAVIILTVGFTIAVVKDEDLPPTLEVKLVKQKSDASPEDARFIANEDNTGGGTVDEAVVRANPFSSTFESDKANIATDAPSAAQRKPTPEALQILTVEQARRDILSKEAEEEKKQTQKNTATIDQLTVQMQALNDIVDRVSQELAERPKRDYIHTRTKKHRYAAYMQAWIAKIERIGNRKYPRGIKGEVLMMVGIARNGTVESIKLMGTISEGRTGEVALNNAAKRVIKQASPFAPFSPEMGDVDVLHIVRTYKFHGQKFSTGDGPRL